MSFRGLSAIFLAVCAGAQLPLALIAPCLRSFILHSIIFIGLMIIAAIFLQQDERE